MIYMDNGATSLHKPACVIEAVTSALTSLGNAGRGATDEALASSRVILQARMGLNKLINGTSPAQIAFALNATESLNTAIKGIFNPGDHVITTATEHNSVLRPLYALADSGVEYSIVDATPAGFLRMEMFEQFLQVNTRGIVVNHASNLTGMINPLAAISEFAKKHDLLLIVDASQTMGAIPIDVQALDIDVLCFTGHKSLLGPQGTGGIYVREDLEIRPLKTGGTGVDTYNHYHPTRMPTALEAGTLNGHGIAGLNASVHYLLDYGVDKIAREEREMLDYFYDRLQAVPTVKIYGDFSGAERCPIISLNIGDVDSSEIAEQLMSTYGIATRAGGHCAPLMHQALGTKDQGVVRFSLGHFTTRAEIDETIAALQQIVTGYSHN